MGLKDVISMVSKVLLKPIWRGISRPFKFISLPPFAKRTLITEPQVVANHDLRSPMEEPEEIHTQVEAVGDMPSLESRSDEEIADDLSHFVEEPIAIERSDEEFVDADDMLLESRKSVMKQVLVALKDPRVNMILVYGVGVLSGGVGKTMLVKKVASRVIEEKLFDAVVFANGTRYPNITRIQGEIAKGLGFKFNDMDTPSQRASRLRHQLKEKRKVLLILYDIWRNIDLEKAGIPYWTDHEGLKILMTSIDDYVYSDKKFKLDLLGEGEAWSLFEKTLGHGIITDSILASIAHQVAKKCVGLPILLVVVATALKGADLHTWTDALEHLKRFENDDKNKQLFSALELSYNILLRGEEIKSLFLLCGFFIPHSISIDVLFKYVWGMGLFGQSKALKDVHNKLQKLLDDLKASTLLMEGDDNSKVRMNYVIRDFAASIACRHYRIFSNLEVHILFKSWAFENEPVLFEALCVHLDNITMHLEIPRLLTVNLEVLVLVSPYPWLQLPQSFLSKYENLQVLDFTNIHFPLLPSSLTFIRSLKKLCLHFCNLEDISMIGEMKNLQVISLAHSHIIQLPRQIAQLTNLEILDLTSCQDLEVIPSNVLSCLTLLEELLLGNSFNQWEVEGPNSLGENAKLDELKHLVNLRILDIHVRDAAMLPCGLFPRKLEAFKIFVGDVWGWSGYEASKTLKLKLNSSNQLQGTGIDTLLERAEELHLHGLVSVKCILYELNDAWEVERPNSQVKNANLDELKYLVNLRTLDIHVKDASMLPHGLFPGKFEAFKISVGDVWGWSGNEASKTIKLELNSSNQLHRTGIEALLERVEELHLYGLVAVKSILYELNDAFPLQMKHLHIKHVFEIQYIVKSVGMSPFLAFPRLETLFLSNLDNLEKLCEGQLMEKCFVNLKKLKMEFCGNIRNLLSVSMAKELVQLEEINVSYCESMEGIIADTNKPSANHNGPIKLAHLQTLTLCDLPKLRGFFIEEANAYSMFQTNNNLNDAFPQMKHLSIQHVSEIQFIVKSVGMSPCLAFSTLETLVLSNLDSLETICDGQLREESFANLKKLEVESCGKVSNLFSISSTKGLMQLEEINVSYCKNMEEIVVVDNNGPVKFSHLRKLNLCGLPKLRRKCIFHIPN